MSPFLSLSLTEKRQVLLAAEDAHPTRMPAYIIEKDYWVTQVLKLLYSELAPKLSLRCKQPFLFKGGTSLSKGYNLINRMSEDIDLAFSLPVLGCEPVNESLHNSRGKRHRHALSIDESAREFVTDYLLPSLSNKLHDLDDGIVIKLISEDPLDIGIFYTRSLSEEEYGGAVESRVLLETGGRSDNQPTDTVLIDHMLGSAIEQMKEDTFSVLALSPKRTLLEKVFGIHTNNMKGKIGLRHARHMYDVVKIHDSNSSWCLDRALFHKVVRFCDHYYKWHGTSCDAALAGPIVLCPTQRETFLAYKADWESMADLFPQGELPYSFDALIEKLSAVELSINNHYFT